MRLYPGQQLRWIEGLGNIIICSTGETPDFVCPAAAPRQHQDWPHPPLLAQQAAAAKAVHAWEGDIQQCDVVSGIQCQPGHGFFAAGHSLNEIILTCQQPQQRLDNGAVVFYK